MKEKSEKSIIFSTASRAIGKTKLTHKSLYEEGDGDDVEGEEVEDVLPVLLQEDRDGLPLLGQPLVGN